MLGFGLNSWTTGDAVDAATDIRVASAAGYQFVELTDWKIEQYLAQGNKLASLRERGRQSGIGFLSVNTLDDSTLHQGAKRQVLIERCHRLCEWAQGLAAPAQRGAARSPQFGLAWGSFASAVQSAFRAVISRLVI